MIKISVIMPVYNSENTLERSINSVLNQTLKNIELICIDDGSTDKSLNILNSFSKEDERIKVFSQKNKGSGKARNKGILESKGEYIAFLDSDDYFIDLNALQQLYDEGNNKNMDMVSGSIQFIEKGNVEFEHFGFKPIKKLKIRPVGDYCLPWYFYRNIFRRSFLIENNIQFPDLLRGQDPIFLAEILSKLDNYLEVPVLYYCYITPTVNKINDPLKYYDYFVHFYQFFKLLMTNDKFKKIVYNYSDIFISMQDRDIYVNNKKELFSLLTIMDKIRFLFYKYGDLELLKNVTQSFDKLIRKINIKNIQINIKNEENYSDYYSEKVIVHDHSTSPKLSLVLPVFNVENYLKKCLDSIINQTLQDIEIICINDGSTDNSLDILKSYEQLDPRINVFTFTNKGLGPSRNRGIERAMGKYIAFVDTDDWIDLEFCEKIFKQAKNTQADIILFNSIEEYGDYQKERIYFPKWDVSNYMDFTFKLEKDKNLLLNNYLTAWSKIYRTSFLIENNLRFKSTLFEDMEFHVESFLYAKKIAYNPNIFYHYRKENSSSIMNTLKDDECYCVNDIINNIEQHLKNFNLYDFYKYNFFNYKIRQFKEKFFSTNTLFKIDFFNMIKSSFEDMNLIDDDLRYLPNDLILFYKQIMSNKDYFEFTREYYPSKELIKSENLNFSLNSNLLFLDNRYYQDNISTDIMNEIISKIRMDLINGNYINLKAYENIIDENLFDYDFYNDKYNIKSDEIDSLLHYIYMDNKNKAPTNYFDNEFYSNEYSLIKNSKINPFIYYIQYGRFEGKDKLNKSINVNSINRRKLNKKIEELDSYLLNENKRNPHLIVSLTSFPERMKDIAYTLYSLFNQSLKPDKIILWLAYDEFPNMEEDIPLDVLNLKQQGLEIKWCENIRSFKKLIPSLKKYPNDIIVTADDDVYYPVDWLKILWEEHLKFPKDIISHRSRKISFNHDKTITSYNTWKISYNYEDASFLNFFTGVGGILYPPNALHDEVLNKELFEKTCHLADDIWFWGMGVKNDTKIRVPKECFPYLIYTNALKDLNIGNYKSLWNFNQQGGNDSSFKKLFKVFPDIEKKLFEEYK